jgi:hypothetical protein
LSLLEVEVEGGEKLKSKVEVEGGEKSKVKSKERMSAIPVAPPARIAEWRRVEFDAQLWYNRAHCTKLFLK